MNENHGRETRILRLRQVMDRVGLKRSTIYAAMRSDTFPRSVQIGRRAVGWLEADINDFVERRPRTGDQPIRAGNSL
jgi:prophage regulatory protein